MSQIHKLKPEPKFEVFGNYILLKKLAEGGMAEVFLARPSSHMGNGRVQVIKRLLPHFSHQSMFLSMFQNEIQVLMGFCHPNTVQLHDFGQVGDQPFIAMEFLDGKNLKDLMTKVQKQAEMIPIPVVLSLVIQAAAGLDYAHTFINGVTGDRANTIHRDISPQNLIVSYEGNLKVIDFGIAKASGNLDEKTRVGTIKGKAAYLSPEQTKGEVLDGRSDVFSLGIVAWELLTLIRFFEQATKAAKRKSATRNDNTAAPSDYNDQIPIDLDIAILKALKTNPADRYQSAREFQTALRQIMLRYFPNYSYADTGTFVRTLFATEIVGEKSELFQLNKEAQQTLFTKPEPVPKPDNTVILNPAPILPTLEPSFELEEMDTLNTRLAQLETLLRKIDPNSLGLEANLNSLESDSLAQEQFDNLLAKVLNIETRDILKIRDNAKVRVIVEGGICIYDLNGKIITKAKIRNCCVGGLCFETTPTLLNARTQVLVEFTNEGFGPKVGLVKCDVKWLTPIEAHPMGHYLGGLQFMRLTPDSTKKLNDYLKTYQRNEGFGVDDR